MDNLINKFNFSYIKLKGFSCGSYVWQDDKSTTLSDDCEICDEGECALIDEEEIIGISRKQFDIVCRPLIKNGEQLLNNDLLYMKQVQIHFDKNQELEYFEENIRFI